MFTDAFDLGEPVLSSGQNVRVEPAGSGVKSPPGCEAHWQVPPKHIYSKFSPVVLLLAKYALQRSSSPEKCGLASRQGVGVSQWGNSSTVVALGPCALEGPPAHGLRKSRVFKEILNA